MTFKIKLNIIKAVFIFFMASVDFAFAQGSLPVDTMAALMVKVLNYDRALENKVNGEMVIGIVSISNRNEARKYIEELFGDLKRMSGKYKIRKLPFRSEIIRINLNTYSSIQELTDLFRNKNINIIVVTEDNMDVAKDIYTVAKDLKINTISSTSEDIFFKNGLALGIALKDQRPKLFVNMENAKNEGSDYSSKLYSLCVFK